MQQSQVPARHTDSDVFILLLVVASTLVVCIMAKEAGSRWPISQQQQQHDRVYDVLASNMRTVNRMHSTMHIIICILRVVIYIICIICTSSY